MTQSDMFQTLGCALVPIRVEVAHTPDPPSQKGSQTSVDAARKVKPDAATRRALVLSFLRGRGNQGATRDEIGKALGMSTGSVCGRIWELSHTDNGVALICETDERRKTTFGGEGFVLRAV